MLINNYIIVVMSAKVNPIPVALEVTLGIVPPSSHTIDEQIVVSFQRQGMAIVPTDDVRSLCPSWLNNQEWDSVIDRLTKNLRMSTLDMASAITMAL